MSVNFSHVLSMFHQKSSQFTTAYLYRLPVRPATLLLRLVDLIFNHIAQNQNITYFPYTHTPEKYLDTLAQRCHCNCQFTHSNIIANFFRQSVWLTHGNINLAHSDSNFARGNFSFGHTWPLISCLRHIHTLQAQDPLRFISNSADMGPDYREKSWSAYHLYGKPGNSWENSNTTVHLGGNFPEKK